MGIALKQLSESDRIRIARELFEVTRQDEHKGELHGCCPIHGEKNPSFSYNYRMDTYHCFACGDDGDLCRLWSKVRGNDEKQGFKAFCEAYNLGSDGSRQSKPSRKKKPLAASRETEDQEDPGSRDPDVLRFFDRGPNDRLSFKPRLLADYILTETSLMSDPSTGLVYRWSGKIWEIYEEEHIAGACIRLLGNESQKGRVEDAVYQVKRLCTIPHGRKMNDQVDWICVENGMLHLRTLELRDHDRDFLATFMLPVVYDPESEKTCKRFLEYLGETVQTAGPMMQLQEFAGYCLTPSTAFEKCLLLLGPGADGKSTFLKVLRELVGSENCAAVSFPDLEDQFQRSSLYGKLLNISTEVGGRAIESAYFKAITSGDPLNAAFKHRNAFEFCPTCKLAFAANRLPRVLDNSDGYFRRILPVQFKRQFIDDYDPQLFEQLKAELSEIFVWAVEGLQRLWEQRGFTQCDETGRLLLDYRRGNNHVLAYVEDCCVLGEDYEVPRRDLYHDYRAYCSESGFTAMNIENFFRELYNSFTFLKKYKGLRIQVEGVRLRYVKGLRLDANS